MYEIIILIIVALLFFSLSGRIKSLEEQIKELKGSSISPSQAVTSAPQQIKTTQSVTPDADLPTPPQPVPDRVGSLLEWMQQDWALKLGALLILIGFGWFVSYAFINQWIGPVGRIVIGLVVGTFVLMFAQFRIRTHENEGVVVAGLGGALELLTIWWAITRYGFFDEWVGFAVMALVVGYMAFIALRYSQLSMAILALVLGGVVPFLFDSTGYAFATVFIYLLTLVGGTIWLVTLKRWNILTFIASAMLIVHSLPYTLTSYYSSTPTLIFEKMSFAFTFGTIFLLAPLIRQIIDRRMEKIDFATMLANAVFILLWIVTAVPGHLQSMMTLLIAGVYVIAGFMVYTAIKEKLPTFGYATIATILLVLAISLETSGPVFTIATTFIITAYAIFSAQLLNNPSAAGKFGLLLVFPMLRSSIFEWGYYYYEGTITLFSPDMIILYAILFAIAAIAYYMYSQRSKDQELARWNAAGFFSLYIYVGTMYAYLILWRAVHILVESSSDARIIVLILYSIIGTTLYVLGKTQARDKFHRIGMVTMGIVAARLIFIETGYMSIAGKIITFIFVGLVFMSTMFFEKKFDS